MQNSSKLVKAFLVFTLLVAGLSAYADLEQRSEDFSTAPQWENNGATNFGYQPYSRNAEGTAVGEAGGQFVRSNPANYYADDVGQLSLSSDALTASGKAYINGPGELFFMGWFRAETFETGAAWPNWPLNCIAFRSDGNDLYLHLVSNTGDWTQIGPLTISGTTYDYTFTYDPSAGGGNGVVTLTVAGVGSINHTLAASGAGSKGDFLDLTRFGMFNARISPVGTMNAYFDDIEYTAQVSPGMSDVAVVDENTIDVTFATTPGGSAADPTSYTLSGEGMGSLFPHPDSVTDQGSNVYRLDWTHGYLRPFRAITVTVPSDMTGAVPGASNRAIGSVKNAFTQYVDTVPVTRANNFDSDPGWAAYNNNIPATDGIKYVTSNNAGGAAAGEVGGQIFNATRSYYAAPVGNLDPSNDSLTASGKFAVTSMASGNASFGWFLSTENSYTDKNFIGCTFDGTSLYLRSFNNEGGTGGLTNVLVTGSVPLSNPVNFTMTYDPTGNGGTGTLSMTCTGGITADVSVNLAPYMKDQIADLDRFGICSRNGGGPSENLRLFLDDLSFTGAPAQRTETRTEDFSKTPRWQASGNLDTPQNYGYRSHSQLVEGAAPGELGGTFIRNDAPSFFADPIGHLDPAVDPLDASGTAILTGSNGAAVAWGYFNAGGYMEDGGYGTDYMMLRFDGTQLSLNYAYDGGSLVGSNVSDVTVGTSFTWRLAYNPVAGAGNGELYCYLNGAATPTVTMNLPAGVRDLFQDMTHFGVYTLQNATVGQENAFYLDDLSYTAELMPGIDSVSVVDASTLDVFFKTDMASGSDLPSNFNISGPGKGSLAANPNSVTATSDSEYRLSWSSGQRIPNLPFTITTGADTPEADFPQYGADTRIDGFLNVYESIFPLPASALEQRTEGFDEDPNWATQSVNIGEFYWRGSGNQTGGAAAGELGGTFRNGSDSYYADYAGVIDPSVDTLTASGRLFIGSFANGNPGVGWFNAEGAPQEHFIGFVFDGSGSGSIIARIFVNGTVYTQTVSTTLNGSDAFDYDLSYDPSGEGSLTLTLSNGKTGSATVNLPVGAKDQLKELTHFGVAGRSGSSTGETASFLLDDLEYTTENPRITNVGPVNDSTIAVNVTKELPTTEDVPAAFTLSGSGKGTLAATPDAVTYEGNGVYNLTWGSGTLDPSQSFTITVDPTRVDERGAEISDNYNDASYTPPAVVSATAYDYRNYLDVEFNVTMGSGMTNAANYTVSGDGLVNYAAQPDSVTALSTSTARLHWATTGQQRLGKNVTITVNTAMTDAQGNALAGGNVANTVGALCLTAHEMRTEVFGTDPVWWEAVNNDADTSTQLLYRTTNLSGGTAAGEIGGTIRNGNGEKTYMADIVGKLDPSTQTLSANFTMALWTNFSCNPGIGWFDSSHSEPLDGDAIGVYLDGYGGVFQRMYIFIASNGVRTQQLITDSLPAELPLDIAINCDPAAGTNGEISVNITGSITTSSLLAVPAGALENIALLDRFGVFARSGGSADDQATLYFDDFNYTAEVRPALTGAESVDPNSFEVTLSKPLFGADTLANWIALGDGAVEFTSPNPDSLSHADEVYTLNWATGAYNKFGTLSFSLDAAAEDLRGTVIGNYFNTYEITGLDPAAAIYWELLH